MTTATLVWSGAATALASLGVALAFKPVGSRLYRFAAASGFALLAALAGAPLVAHGLRTIWPYYLPLMLVWWAALPTALGTAAAAFLDHDFRLRLRWNMTPALLAVLLAAVTWMLPRALRDALFIGGEVPAGSRLGGTIALVAFALVLATSLTWVDAIFRTVRRLGTYHRQLRDRYSNADQFEARWLGWFVVLPGAYALAIVLLVLNDNLTGLPAPGAAMVLASATAVIFALLLWISRAAPSARIETSGPGLKYARAPLTDEQADRIKDRLQHAMLEDAAFLDPLLSLQSLARRIGVPANQLSRYLNETNGLSFFDYVNRLRTRHARDLMILEEQGILDAAFAAGFNSKSTYYKAFNREYGRSPAVYLREHSRIPRDEPVKAKTGR